MLVPYEMSFNVGGKSLKKKRRDFSRLKIIVLQVVDVPLISESDTYGTTTCCQVFSDIQIV